MSSSLVLIVMLGMVDLQRSRNSSGLGTESWGPWGGLIISTGLSYRVFLNAQLPWRFSE